MPLKMRIICISLIPVFLHGVLGLRLTEVVVPRHANLNDNVDLKCGFELGRARLYSVKWYKDDFEFYRYMPDNRPQTQIFPVLGIHLDESSSNMNQVTLTQVEYRSSGTYKCEVSTEAPNFDTVFDGGNMTVLSYPDDIPKITGIMDTYTVGEYVTGNCTSGRSFPAPRVNWFINGIKAESWLLDKYPVVEYEGPLYSRAVGLRFQAEKRHFIEPGSSVKLKCSVMVADLPPQATIVEPRLASASANQQLAQERLRNTGSGFAYLSHWLVPLWLISMVAST